MGSIHTISGAHSNRFEVGGYHWNPAMLEDPTSQGTVSASTTVRPLKSIPTGPESDAIRAIINTFLNGAPVSFDWEWLALRKRAFEMGLFPTSMDEIVNRYIGLEEVKRKTIALIEMVLQDKALPVARRQTSRRAYNFMLMGKPGTGKSQVGELLAKLLRELELRPDDSKYVKITGTNLALMKDDDFDQLLKDVTPGILFVDEIHQLDPMGGGSGRARTNILMNMAEDKRTEFSLFGTGYRKKIEETFFSSDPGMKSRFPYIWEFKDYNESELRTIFLKMVAQDNWKLAPIDNSPIDVATVLARRLALQSEDPTFANARAVRNAYENSLMASSVRKKRLGILATSEEAYTLTVADVVGEPIDIDSNPLVKKLQAMIGLDDLKASIMNTIAQYKYNYNRELRGLKPAQSNFHAVFVGKPGTGKTTVAELYAKILAEMRLLSDGSHVLIRASELLVGHESGTEEKVNAFFDNAQGKVVIIDEAYVLADTRYGQHALETMTGRIQTGFQDMAVILAGYEDKMADFFQRSNIGLRSRFDYDRRLVFANYSRDELIQIMKHMATTKFTMTISHEMATLAIDNVVFKRRSLPDYGNAREIELLLGNAQKRWIARRGEEDEDGNFIIVERDLFAEPNEVGSAESVLKEMVNMDEIIAHIKKLEISIRVDKAECKEDERVFDPKDYLRVGYTFNGPPGTGKSTVARMMGEVFRNLDILSSSKPVEVGPNDIIGSHVGEASELIRGKLDAALGGVLIIDEAYGLYKSSYGRQVLDDLVQFMTNPKYEGKLLIILTGYQHEIEHMLKFNAGLYRRFAKSLSFHSFGIPDCIKLAKRVAAGKYSMSLDGFEEELAAGFSDLTQRENFSNGDDVVKLVGQIKMEKDARLYSSVTDFAAAVRANRAAPVEAIDITQAFYEFASRRRRRVDTAQSTQPAAAPNLISLLRAALGGKGPGGEGGGGEFLDEGLTSMLQPEAYIEDINEQIKLPPPAPKPPAKVEKVDEEILKKILAQKLLKEEEDLMALIREHGKCVMGFDWLKQADGSYICAGGSHSMSHEEANTLFQQHTGRSLTGRAP